MKYGIVLIFVLPLLIIMACDMACDELTDRPLDSSMMPGVYLANHHQRIDMLILRDDSIYIHSFTTFEGEQYIDSSGWELVMFGSREHIRLDHYTSKYESGFPRSYRGAGVHDKIIRRTINNKIMISIDPDLGYWFVKAGP